MAEAADRTAAPGNPSFPALGLALFVLALLCFASADTVAKTLVASYAVPLVVTVRYLVNLALLVALFAPSHGAGLFAAQRRGLVIVRGACLVTASLFFGLALQRMPLAETTAIVFIAPILVVLVATRLLGERIGLAGWVAAALGFAGVLLIVRPGAGLDPWGVASALAAMLGTVAYTILSRVLAATETTVSLLFHAVVVGVLAFGATLPWSWGGPQPSALQVALFLAIGTFSALGHYLFTAAFRDAPASILAPLNYLQLVWAGLLGWVVFRHVPDGLTVAGMAVVTLSGVATALRSRRR